MAEELPDLSVVATIKNSERMGMYAFEAVLLVPSHLTTLQGQNVCHPGFYRNQQWSPRVLKTLDNEYGQVFGCPENKDNKTPEEIELEMFSKYFNAACRPGPWSFNSSLDAALKKKYPQLCKLCEDDTCAKYNYDDVISANNEGPSSHISALQCLMKYEAVAYVAWHHVSDFFSDRENKDKATSYAVMCPDGSKVILTDEVLKKNAAPCAFVRQPWGVILAQSHKAEEIANAIDSWWPDYKNPGRDTWQSILFDEFVGGENAMVLKSMKKITIREYVSNIRNISKVDNPCIPAHRWCTISFEEQRKCLWLKSAANILGLQPSIDCHKSRDVFECFKDIKENKADFIAIDSNYGYLARQHYGLTPVKIVQNEYNNPSAFSRVVALLKESTVIEGKVSSFEDLRGKSACFPEFGGIAYVSFVRAAHERGVVPPSQCDYGRAVGEFFGGTCAPGAVDAAHSLGAKENQDFDASRLCSTCRTTSGTLDFTCAWDTSNKYFGKAGALKCLANPNSHVAFVETGNLSTYLREAGLAEEEMRVLCRNNTLAARKGIDIDDGCLLAYVVDSEVLTRNDSTQASLSSLLDTLDGFFGFKLKSSNQLINFELFSKFNGINDLLFEDSAIGFLEPSTSNLPAKNYVELFKHLESCTNGGISCRLSFIYAICLLCLVLFL